jgi:hypothetical protein
MIAVVLIRGASITPTLAPGPTAGITSGQGGQAGASSNTAHTMGQAGTAGTQAATPRQLHFGAGGTAQGSSKP